MDETLVRLTQRAIETAIVALQELRQYLLAASPSETVAAELECTERLINALGKEKKASSELIERHIRLTTADVRLTSRHAEEN